MRTIPELIERAVEGGGDRAWLSYEDTRYSFVQAHRHIGGIAAALDGLGVRRGSLVLATMRNSDTYLFLWLAAMRLGAVFVPVDPSATRSELEGLIGQVRPGLVVTDAALHELVGQSITSVGGGAQSALVEDLVSEAGDSPPPVQAHPDDVAVMIPTSGTTGGSKLVMQTHRAYVLAAEGFPFWLGLTADDRLMTSLPLFHVNAPVYSVLGSAAAGAGLILLPRFSAHSFIDSARRYGATEFNAIGAMLEILMRQPDRDDDLENPVRLCYTGPSPSKRRQLQIERRFGFEIVGGYALSESLYGLVWRRGTRPFGTLGSLRQHPTLGEINFGRVRGGGRVVGAGATGELELKNPAIMTGYYNMPEETKEVLADGWLRTGDLVTANADGTYTFAGRKKELIRRRGENLSPLEVEVALEGHPAVAEAAVVGIPSELSEEDVKAFIVFTTGAAAPLVEIREFVAGRLARFKVPRYLEVVDGLPHTATGRVAKHRLPRDRTETEEDFEARQPGETAWPAEY